MPVCCVCNASSYSWDSRFLGTSFHRFPTRYPRICDEWRKFAGLAKDESVEKKLICSSHFLEEDIVHTPIWRKVKLHSFPCLNPPIAKGALVISSSDTGESKTSDSTFLDTCDNVEYVEVVPPENSSRAEELKVDGIDPLKLEVSDNDIAFLDHDYLGTLKTCDQPKNGDSKENGKDPSNQLVLQDLKKELCRLCGKKGPLLMPIFNPTSCAPSGEITLPDKIEAYLPIKVKMEDPLPSHICIRCSELLSRWHELYLTCVAADAVLWKTFGGESDVSSLNDRERSSNRNREIDAQHVDNTKKQQDKRDESLKKANEDCEILCSVCGMNTPSKPLKEDDSLIEEFEKYYSKVRSFKYKCRYCCEFFLSSRARKEHFVKCRQLSTLCECCGKNGICRKDLQKHKYIKHQQVIVERACDRCGKCFKSLAIFKRHYFLVHVQNLEKKFCCDHCCTAYADEKIYRSHMKRHERGELKTVFQIEKYLDGGVYVCPVCKEIFNDNLSLVLHLISQKKIKCPSCLIRISNEKKFLLHVCKEWHCGYCSKSFKSKIKCVTHERLHTGEKPIKCRTCDKKFRSYLLRSSHETTHAPSFECTICNKKIRNKYVFQDHLQWHDGKVFLCSICGKGFCARRNVRKHAYKVHKGEKVEIIVSNVQL